MRTIIHGILSVECHRLSTGRRGKRLVVQRAMGSESIVKAQRVASRSAQRCWPRCGLRLTSADRPKSASQLMAGRCDRLLHAMQRDCLMRWTNLASKVRYGPVDQPVFVVRREAVKSLVRHTLDQQPSSFQGQFSTANHNQIKRPVRTTAYRLCKQPESDEVGQHEGVNVHRL